jgi:outer membrane biosynthesis protein TonB
MARLDDTRPRGRFPPEGSRGKLSLVARRSRLSLTLLVSVLLHAALLIALSRETPSVRPARTGTVSTVELDILYPPAEAPPPPASEPARQPPARASAPASPPVERTPRVTAADPKKAEPSELAGPGTGESPAAAAAPGTKPLPEDAPLAEAPAGTGDPLDRLDLRGLTGTGRTVRNGDGSEPDSREVAARQAEEARQKVDGWARDSLAEARAASGAPHPYFAQMQDAFSKTLVNPPKPDLRVLSARMKREQVDAIQRFGETGSPYAPSGPRDHRLEQRDRFRAAVEAGRAANMFMVDVTEPILALAAVLEVRQERDGTLVDISVVEGSGDPTFDSWAMSQLRDAIARMDAPEDASAGVGLRDDGIRSRWRLKEYLGNPSVQIHLIGVY